MNPGNRPDGRIREIFHGVSQSLFVPEALGITDADELSRSTLQTGVKAGGLTLPLRFLQNNSFESHLIESLPGLLGGTIRRSTIDHDQLDLIPRIINL